MPPRIPRVAVEQRLYRPCANTGCAGRGVRHRVEYAGRQGASIWGIWDARSKCCDPSIYPSNFLEWMSEEEMRVQRSISFLLVIGVLTLATRLPAQAQQYTPPPTHPKVSWSVRCGLTDLQEHNSLRQKARAHVIAKGKSLYRFERRIENCPKRDIVYFRKVLGKWL